MRRQEHFLPADAPGTARKLVSLHFGAADTGRRAYLQAALHADEPPGILVLHHLAERLRQAEAAGRVRGEVVLVPMANPIGLDQHLLYHPMGRFELNSADNFNRNYPDLPQLLDAATLERLGQDPQTNVRLIRAALKNALARIRPTGALDTLRHTLLSLAFDADIVLDLHCDYEAVMHLYAETPYWRQAEPLARYLRAEVMLLAEGSGTAGGGSFDEAVSSLWWRLPRLAAARGMPVPVLPLACFSATVELRGQTDVEHGLAKEDADHLFDYLCHEGLIEQEPPAMPPLLGEPTPLSGSIPVTATHGGVVSFHVEVGDLVEAGAPIADIVDPIGEQVTTLEAPVRGRCYARLNHRVVRANQSVARIAGALPLRHGALLGP